MSEAASVLGESITLSSSLSDWHSTAGGCHGVLFFSVGYREGRRSAREGNVLYSRLRNDKHGKYSHVARKELKSKLDLFPSVAYSDLLPG